MPNHPDIRTNTFTHQSRKLKSDLRPHRTGSRSHILRRRKSERQKISVHDEHKQHRNDSKQLYIRLSTTLMGGGISSYTYTSENKNSTPYNPAWSLIIA